jgi:hypothetical protein
MVSKNADVQKIYEILGEDSSFLGIEHLIVFIVLLITLSLHRILLSMLDRRTTWINNSNFHVVKLHLAIKCISEDGIYQAILYAFSAILRIFPTINRY